MKGCRIHLIWLHSSYHLVRNCRPLPHQHNLSAPLHARLSHKYSGPHTHWKLFKWRKCMRQQDPTHWGLHAVSTAGLQWKLREVLIVLDRLNENLPKSPVKVWESQCCNLIKWTRPFSQSSREQRAVFLFPHTLPCTYTILFIPKEQGEKMYA